MSSVDAPDGGRLARVIENAPVLVDELDRRKAAMSPGDQQAEMAFWEAASKLGVWYVVNRGTRDDPRPSGFDVPGTGKLLGVYSTPGRAGAVAGAGGTFLGVPTPQALDWLASFGQQGVTGIVMDHPGPWIPLATLGYLERWLPAGQVAVTTGPVVAAPEAQAAMDSYLARPDDAAYAEVLRRLAGESLLVVIDPHGDGQSPTHIVNHRDERVVLAFTDSTRLTRMYDGKAVDVVQRPGSELLRLAAAEYDAVVVDPQHPSSFAANPAWIRDVLG